MEFSLLLNEEWESPRIFLDLFVTITVSPGDSKLLNY